MIAKIKTLTHFGLSIIDIWAECHIMNGQVVFNLVGMADKSVTESKERIRVIINELSKANKDIRFPLSRITVNLAPAEVVKRGNQFDLAILLSILSFQGIINNPNLDKCTFLGELGMDGKLKPISNIVNYCLYIQKSLKDNKIFIPKDNAVEASYLTTGNIYAVESVHEIIAEINTPGTLEPLAKKEPIATTKDKEYVDMKDIIGQKLAKRALEISAAGGHNIIMIGEAGSGKTLLSKAIQGILPDLSEDELLEVARIRSLTGMSSEEILNASKPFRSPHHSCSSVSLLGGGKKIDPGEVTKAHLGVLFLDELTEFDKKTLDSLRQPLEDKEINIARAIGSVKYPCNFQLIATMNPSFKGDFENTKNIKENSGMKKISGPILDRIDLQIQVFRPKNTDIIAKSKKGIVSEIEFEDTDTIKTRVIQAKNIQIQRYGNSERNSITKNNASMSISEINTFCLLDEQSLATIMNFVEQKNISMRSYHKILKVSRTIADLDDKNDDGCIKLKHVIEAMQFRL